ncbi:MAG: DUF3015 family protein [Leptospiraceae bacterium]|nr:DUF3015 family protein [Leptospiraceae bacterium]MCP5495149.1 DUF3015 family protein [Leptospiraceae bacterium]
MKKTLISILGFILALFFNISTYAGEYGMAGCGFGSIILGGQNNFLQVFAVTSNASSGSQTFGITSGTSNCTEDGIVQNNKAQEAFVHLNYHSLEQEMATGKGEKLDTLANLFGCSKGKTEFASMTKKSYKSLFSKENNDPSKLYLALKTEVSKDESLKKVCN